MKLIKATKEQLLKLQPGTVVLSDIDEHVSDFAIFKGYNEMTGTITVVDCMAKKEDGSYTKNISEYDGIIIVNVEETAKD